MKKEKQKLVKRILSITSEQDKWIKIQGKQKPFKTASQYVRTVIQKDYDCYKERLSGNTRPIKKS